jgi:hypothetical protein
MVTGPDVWITDVAPYGTIQISNVPEPTATGLVGGLVAGLAAWCLRKSGASLHQQSA